MRTVATTADTTPPITGPILSPLLKSGWLTKPDTCEFTHRGLGTPETEAETVLLNLELSSWSHTRSELNAP